MNTEAQVQELLQRVAALEVQARAANDYVAICNLQAAYGYYVDKTLYDEAADLFSSQADRVWRGRGTVPQSGIERARRFRPSTSRRSRAVDTTSVPWQRRRLASTTPRSARSRHASLSS